MNQKTPLSIGIFAISTILLSACNNASDNAQSESYTAQVADTTIVNSAVYCDGVEKNSSGSVGQFNCPPNTALIQVRGGVDGSKNTQGEIFPGILSAPPSIKTLTPLTTLAVALSSDQDNIFVPAMFEQSAQTIAGSLGIPSIEFQKEPLSTFALIKLSAQIHQIITAFAPTVEDYAIVSKALSMILLDTYHTQQTADLVGDMDATLYNINQQLLQTKPSLALEKEELAKLSMSLQAINASIETSKEIASVILASQGQMPFNAALTLNKDQAPMGFFDKNGNELKSYTLNDFQNDTLKDDMYLARVNGEYSHINFGASAFIIKKTLIKSKVSVGVQIRSTDKPYRHLAITTSGALLSMEKDNPHSMQITLPKGTEFHAQAINKSGTESNAVFTVNGGKMFSSENGGFGVSLDIIADELKEHGYDNLAQHKGNYEVTIALGGIKINMMNDNIEQAATPYSVTSYKRTVSGSGFKGYISVY